MKNDYIKNLKTFFGTSIFIEFLSKYYYSYKLDTIYHHHDPYGQEIIEVVLENKYTELEVNCVFHSFKAFLKECPFPQEDINYNWVRFVFYKLKCVDKDLAKAYKKDYKLYLQEYAKKLNSKAGLLK